MSNWFTRRPFVTALVGMAMGLLVGVGMMVGTLFAVTYERSGNLKLPDSVLQQMVLNASTSHSGSTFAMATGWIDSDMEGLFMLDYLTGALQCWVIHPRTGTFFARFQHNVVADLGVQQGKNPDYVMVTGQATFIGRTGTNSPANTVLYVADGNTGNVAAYTVMWNRTMAQSGTPITGPFTLLGLGKARELAQE